MSQLGRAWAYAKSLKARLALFLSLAILPLGIIAVMQTAAVVRDAQSLEQQDILARTAQAAGTERALLRRAYGSAVALGSSAVEVGVSSEACERVMRRFIDNAQAYVYASFATADGIVECSSDGERMDLSGDEDWQSFIEQPQPNVSVNLTGGTIDQSVLVATVPIFDGSSQTLLGAASVALPHSLTDTLLAAQVEQVDLALIDEAGRVLSASTGITNIEEFETLSVSPDALGVTQRGIIFSVQREDGTDQLAALVPLIEDRVFVLGLWNGSVQNYAVSILGAFTPLFPILMWGVAFVVGFLALDRLVLRHLRELRHRMASFSFDDPSNGFANLEDPPAEFRDIAETYNRMIDRMLANRAELADSLEEKELLLREVHHRVKNNLQLIASILNMQMRSVPDGEAKRVLRRVQDRVMSLSAIHKALYSGTTMSTVRADKLLAEVLQGAFSVGIPQGKGVETSLDLDPLDLDPDQAVPLALLANETVTNAVKYLGRPDSGPPTLSVRLIAGVGREVTLEIENTMGTAIQDALASDGTGLGGRLVEAFVSQLGGTFDVIEENGTYKFRTQFTAFALEAEEQDGEYTDDDDGADSLNQTSRDTSPLARAG